MEVLLAYGANINVEGAGEPNSTRSSIGKNTPLMAAAYAGAAEAVGFLLKQHADWRLVDSDGKTALEVAFENQHQEVAAIIEAFANDERTTYVSAPRSHTPVELIHTRAHTHARKHTHTHTHTIIMHTLFLERPARSTDCAAVRCAWRRNRHRTIRKLTRRIDDLEMNPASDRTEMQGLKDQRERLKQEQKAADDARVARRRGGRGA
jgi:hypothetical protein